MPRSPDPPTACRVHPSIVALPMFSTAAVLAIQVRVAGDTPRLESHVKDGKLSDSAAANDFASLRATLPSFLVDAESLVSSTIHS